MRIRIQGSHFNADPDADPDPKHRIHQIIAQVSCISNDSRRIKIRPVPDPALNSDSTIEQRQGVKTLLKFAQKVNEGHTQTVFL